MRHGWVSAMPPHLAHRSSTSGDEDRRQQGGCRPQGSDRLGTRETSPMNGQTFARLALVVLLVVGAIALGVNAYDAGVTAGLAQNGTIAVAPGYPVGPYVGWGWGFGHGFGFFGFFGGLLFLILLFALLRAAFGGGRHHGWDGRGGRGPWRSGWQDAEARSG